MSSDRKAMVKLGSSSGSPSVSDDAISEVVGESQIDANNVNNKKMPMNSTTSLQSAAAWWFLCDFSSEELFILRSSFGALKNRLENVAVAAFTSLFDERPDAFAVFIGKKVLPETRNDVAYSWETKQHGLRVLSVVEKCLNRIDRWDLFEDVVCGLAARHLQYGAKPIYILSLFGCLRRALLNEMEVAGVDEDGLPVPQQQQQQQNSSESGDNQSPPKYELRVSAINAAWNKFFRTLGLALISEMLTLQEQPQLAAQMAKKGVNGTNNNNSHPKAPTSNTSTPPPPVTSNGKNSRSKKAHESTNSFIKAVTSKLSMNSEKN